MYREAQRIGRTLDDALPWLRQWGHTSEVVLVDDGSPDDTVQVVKPYLTHVPDGALQRVRLAGYKENRGKGGAVLEGLSKAVGQNALVMDADNAATIREVEHLLPMMQPKIGIAAGSRNSNDSQVEAVAFRKISGLLFKGALAAMGLGIIRDTQCGYKLYSRAAIDVVIQHAKETGYVFDLEHMLLARKAGLGVVERGIKWKHVEGGQVNAVSDGLKMLAQSAKLKIRLSSLRIEQPKPSVTLEPKPGQRVETVQGTT